MDYPGRKSNTLQELATPLVKREDCYDAYSVFLQQVTDNMLCTSTGNNSGTCQVRNPILNDRNIGATIWRTMVGGCGQRKNTA